MTILNSKYFETRTDDEPDENPRYYWSNGCAKLRCCTNLAPIFNTSYLIPLYSLVTITASVRIAYLLLFRAVIGVITYCSFIQRIV